MVTIRQVEVVSATPASTLSLLRRPSCIPSTQMMPPMAMRTNATIRLIASERPEPSESHRDRNRYGEP